MQPRAMRKSTVPLGSSIVKADGEHALRLFKAPTTSNEEKKSVKITFNARAHGQPKRQLSPIKPVRNALLKPNYKAGGIKDVEHFIDTLDIHTFTDEQAQEITFPFNVRLVNPIETLMQSLEEQLLEHCIRQVTWNTPSARVEESFNSDLRFSGDWWLCMCDPQSQPAQRARAVMGVSRPSQTYAPLLVAGERSEESENQLLADVAARLRGKLYHLEMLHIDRISLTPERMLVLAATGFASRDNSREAFTKVFGGQQRAAGAITKQLQSKGQAEHQPEELRETILELKVVSLPLCEIGTASLLVLLTALASVVDYGPHVSALDLSFNNVDHGSLYALALKLPQTRVVRLSLRGNRLSGKDSTEFRDFLLEGCAMMEELDLSYTLLTAPQVCVLIDVIPNLLSLHVLLLDGIDIPAEKSSAFSKAIADSRICVLSINGSVLSLDMAYMEGLRTSCEKNANKKGNRNERRRSSFFRNYYRLTAARGLEAPLIDALPVGYHPFRTNDPSIQELM